MIDSLAVLVVEDEVGLNRTLLSYLEDEGYEVDSALNAVSAERYCRSKNYGAIIVDLRLPDTDGVSLISSLYVINPNASFLISTGSRDFILPDQLKALGMSDKDVFLKPIVDLSTLSDAIANKASL